MFMFAWPWMALLLILPLIAWFFLPPNSKTSDDTSPEIRFPYTERLRSAFAISSGNKIRSKFWFVLLLSLFWVFLVISTMKPQMAYRLNEVNRKAYDIMLAVDISLSMNALDLSTTDKNITRLDVVKEVVGNFIKKRHGDRLGLILFGEYAYLQAPMTFDGFALGQMLINALPGMAGGSTAIGDAIGVGVRELRNRSEKSRVLILLTDGTDNSSNLPPLQAAQIAQAYGIRLYTIGVGKDGMVPYKDPYGKTMQIESDINEELLEKIADMTGGKFFRAKDDKSLEKIYNKINELEKIDLTAPEYRSKSLHRYPLGIACLLFLILCLMPLYKRAVHGI